MAPSDTPATFESFQAELARLVAQFDRQHPTTLQNALTKTDREIDQLVYQLYGLTPAEIALVEGNAPAS